MDTQLYAMTHGKRELKKKRMRFEPGKEMVDKNFHIQKKVRINYEINKRFESNRRSLLIRGNFEPVPTGGETGIRTLDTLSSILTLQVSAFDHSAISPIKKF